MTIKYFFSCQATQIQFPLQSENIKFVKTVWIIHNSIDALVKTNLDKLRSRRKRERKRRRLGYHFPYQVRNVIQDYQINVLSEKCIMIVSTKIESTDQISRDIYKN